MPKLYLDQDGVLADFEAGAQRVFGIPAANYEETFGTAQFWGMLKGTPDFFYNLEMLAGAAELWHGCANANPTILTGCPLGNWAQPQKIRWATETFSISEDRIICCFASEKYTYCEAGDVIVDDREHYRAAWEAAGGIFVHYKGDYMHTLDELRSLAAI